MRERSELPRSPSSAVDKALDLVEAIAGADRPLRLTEIASVAGMHRATAYRVLLDLVRRGWVMRAGDHYLPGTAVLQLSEAAARHSLVALCRPTLDALSHETDLMVNLQVLEADRSRVVDVVCPDRLQMINHLDGELLPVHRFAGPLALVALLDEDSRAAYLAPAQAAGHPMSGEVGLLAELARARTSGFALERGRNEAMIASISRAVVSAKAGPICAITIVGPDAEFDEGHLDRLRSELQAATDAVAAALGGLTATARQPT